MKPLSKAFTLIELLIVVAIIAILAAIAVPNFLEAQTRAKVSRAKADMRSLATGIETYRLDWNIYLYCNRPAIGIWTPGRPNHRPTLERLSSPIAYLSGIEAFTDPFKTQGVFNQTWSAPHSNFGSPEDLRSARIYFYYARNELAGGNARWDQAENNNTKPPKWWFTESSGPDGWRFFGDRINSDPGKDVLSVAMYDASNGTVSKGSIWRAGGAPPRAGDQRFYELIQGQY